MSPKVIPETGYGISIPSKVKDEVPGGLLKFVELETFSPRH